MKKVGGVENSDFAKIKSIMKIQELGLPFPETIFIFDAEKQDDEIEEFLKDRELVIIRTDSMGNPENCPNKLDCPSAEAKQAIKKFNSKGYAAILSEFVPFDAKFSGNILFLSDRIIIETMKGNPLTLMNRHGIVHEHIHMDSSLKEIFHWGKRVADAETLEKIIRMFDNLNMKNKIVEFGVGPDWLYIWQIRDDKTSEKLESI